MTSETSNFFFFQNLWPNSWAYTERVWQIVNICDSPGTGMNVAVTFLHIHRFLLSCCHLFHLSMPKIFRTIQLEAPAFLPPYGHKEKTVWLLNVYNELVCLLVLKGWNFWKIGIVWCICLWNVIDDESAMQLNASSSPGIETKSITYGV